ncbi:hypothetical protein ABID65_009491 [Bradyrhizobium sp. S3.9.2]
MASDGKTQTVRFVQAQFLDSSCLPVRQHHGLADQFRLGFVTFPQNSGGVRFGSGHCLSCLHRIRATVHANLGFLRVLDGCRRAHRSMLLIGAKEIFCSMKAQTQRLLRAISDPHSTIIGHMTGRQLQRRPGYEIDIEKLLRACAKQDVVVEIKLTRGGSTWIGAGTGLRSSSAAC